MELLSAHLWLHIKREARVSTRMSAAIAYVTDVSDLVLREGDILVVNASDKALEAGSTDPRELQVCLDAGVRLYSLAGLHAKMIAFDHSAFVGSMNASWSSRDRLIECALLTRDASLVVQVRSLIDALAGEGTMINGSFIDRAADLFVRPSTELAVPSASTHQRKLWYLEKCPHTSHRNLRAYFLALIVAQLGDLKPGEVFALWPNVRNMSQHLQCGRLEKIGSRYLLTSIGVDYFSSEKQWPDPSRFERFFRAVTTGNEDFLPEDMATRALKPFYV